VGTTRPSWLLSERIGHADFVAPKLNKRNAIASRECILEEQEQASIAPAQIAAADLVDRSEARLETPGYLCKGFKLGGVPVGTILARSFECLCRRVGRIVMNVHFNSS
jgi:hypothetical protein